mmetsp:Transcript_26825/g.62644  ORF Transcript_26825/g.62644 Transcript_26825/m.62644 type:complete len:203 (-) Transcript_26825:2-610(-)
MCEPCRPAKPARHELTSLAHATGNQALHLGKLRAVCDRPDVVARLCRRADTFAGGGLSGDCDRALIHRRLNKHACGRVARLARIVEDMAHASPHDGLKVVDIREDEVRPLAPKLEHDALARIGGGLGDRHTSAGRAGKRDHIDVGMARQPMSGVGVAVDQVEGARREARLVHHLCEEHARERRKLRRFEDDSAAGGERGRRF